MLLHILLEKGHFEKLNCEIKFMGTFNTAKNCINYCSQRYTFYALTLSFVDKLSYFMHDYG